ncbi:hypothetical protein TSUD_245740 [Trifolium subterraneum]|uniref:Reverse transcriptase domain-containing protein n=1 Tax=Trifolium subterraneum TaxID=3900 RepID=A0A2Z6P356_TRISU|nr:hypothetical protein TSUD_245740 [Trifolium subterraneum]
MERVDVEAEIKGDDIYGDWLVVDRKRNKGRKSRPKTQQELANVQAEIFNTNIDNCGLIDLGSFSTKFTWQGHCRGGRIVHRRLDRSFCNLDWRLKFPEATVEHLVRRHSDHNPILLRCSNAMTCHEGRPFRFQAAWFTHSDYPQLVKNTWSRDRNNIIGCLQNVAQESITFNKEVFGNIFARKKEVEARLQGIQRALENIDSANLLRLQKELLTSYENILFQEEALWFQKSREQWVKLGSRNTSFFHAQCIIRRKRNKIHGIRLSSGEWCTDPEVMKTEALNFFKELFCTNQIVAREGNVNGMAVLDDDALQELARPISKKEVFDALMSMKSYKAPGPDGFQPIFFKLFWNDIGDDIWQFVQSAFANGRYDPKVCENLIVLLPKGDRQVTFKDFRPISLCNVTYKLISKVIVSRLRPFLDGIISPLQNSFIPEKAYDRVNWSFLKDTLVMFKFPPSVISLIMFGITSTSNTILWNGSKAEAFTPKRGLRQGDPLSPYLFVLCMERLGALISKHVADGSWSPMQITKDRTRISHLFFADDVLLFEKANVSQARIVNEVLERFCAMSGLKISLEKSKFCTSAGVSRRRREDIAVVTQIHAIDKFEKYLGFKMFYGKVRKQDFSNVYDRVSAKLASWKSRLLNKAGRVVLANSVLSSLPSYHMQINWLPQGMCDDLDRTVRRFIWKGTGDTGMHLVGWEKITQPRRFGGLGVRIARLQNVSLLGKLIWEISNSPGKLWVKLFIDKYTKGRHLFNVSVSGGSCIWNSLAKALHMLRDGFTFKIGDGNSRFWYYPWALKENLCSTVPFVAIQDTDLKINDVWCNGRWHLEKLYTSIPDEARNSILLLQPYIVNDIPDVWVWQNSSNGVYTTKDADVGKSHGCIIFIIMWFVWCSRNDAIFNNNKAIVHNLVAKVHSMLSFCIAAFKNTTSGSGGNSEQRLVVWPRPAEGTVCLNVHGSMLGSLQTAGFGGLIRNSFSAFLKGFYGTASQSSVLYAEIMAILHGLHLCWNNGYRSIVCYSDSLQAVSLIKDGVSHFHTFANEIHPIRQLLRRDWTIVIEHILREGNACADVLAKKGSSTNSPIVIVDSPPPELSNALSVDARGVVFVRE